MENWKNIFVTYEQTGEDNTREFDKDKEELEEEYKAVKRAEAKANEENKHKSHKGLAFFTAAIIAAGGVGFHLYRNRTPEVDVTNGDVVKSISDNTNFDEIAELYDTELVFSNASDLDGDKVCYALSGEKDIIASIDKISDYIEISDRLEGYNLGEILDTKDGLLPLTEEEKKVIEDMTKAELLSLMDTFEADGDINYKDFTMDAIRHCNTARYLDYAEKQINTQLMKYGSKFLQKYPELIIQSKIIDKTGLPIEKYKEIVIKNIDSDDEFEACYYEKTIGCYYNVKLDDKYLASSASYGEFFEKYLINSDNVTFKKFKNEAKKAINDYKLILLKDYSLETDGNSHVLESETSNPEVREKVKELK